MQLDTRSTNFPTTSGAYDTSYNDGYNGDYYDVFVSKLNGGLTRLLASTYLGGSNVVWGQSLAPTKTGYKNASKTVVIGNGGLKKIMVKMKK